jgi:hypothetical protein
MAWTMIAFVYRTNSDTAPISHTALEELDLSLVA